MTLIRDLIEIPEQIGGEDFVLKLADAVRDDRAEATLAEYVITPAVADRFGEALDLVAGALGLSRRADGSFQSGLPKQGAAAYLHGSFGSGKSHFMAVLSLLLGGNVAVRSRPELAAVIARHGGPSGGPSGGQPSGQPGSERGGWLGTKRFLLVPCHMLGATSIEEQVFGAYIEQVRRLHPDAEAPRLFGLDEVIHSAEAIRRQFGDEQFFKVLNRDADEGWGDEGARWTPDRYEQAGRAPATSPERQELVSDLSDCFNLGSAKAGTVSFEEGLELITRHAKALGYDAIILFLDELVLWLLGRMSDESRLAIEVEKLVKLVESQRMDRPIPVISFIARQRDLRTLIGDSTTGAERSVIDEKLAYHEARFRRITLESTDLPEIAARRLLSPRDDAARTAIDSAFQQFLRSGSRSLPELLGSQHTEEEFRKLYPFSPVLVEALVASASMLQRDRTALRAMLQILHSQRNALTLGDVIPVGDLYDVIKHGTEAISAEYTHRFNRAGALYFERLVPLLEQAHGLTLEAVERLPWDDQRRRAWRTDDRILKTLLMGALVPGVAALRHLTARRIAALNHGTIRAPIPGGEASAVLDRCRRWAGTVAELQIIGDSADPEIRLELSKVDVEGVVRLAQHYDSDPNRRKHLVALVREDLNLESDARLSLLWRGVDRPFAVDFRNVASLGPASLRHDEEGWRIHVDLPYDARPDGTDADLEVLRRFVAEQRSTRTVVWLPRFLGEGAKRDLGRFVILSELLASEERFDECARHLSAESRVEAKALLRNQLAALRTKLQGVLRAAYGVASNPDAMAALAGDPAAHRLLVSLEEGFTPQPPPAGSLRQGLENLAQQALLHQFPKAPDWPRKFSRAELEKVLEKVREAAQNTSHRVELADPALRRLCADFAVPLDLAQVGSAMVLRSTWLDAFEAVAARSGSGVGSPGGPQPGQRVSVKDLWDAAEQPQRRGLPPAVLDLLVLTFAEARSRVVVRDGARLPALRLGDLRPSDELHRAELPSEDEWKVAKERGEAIFGETGFLYRTVHFVGGLADRVRKAVESAGTAPRELRDALVEVHRRMGLGQSHRLRDSEVVVELFAALRHRHDTDLIRALAAQPIEGPCTPQSLGASFKQAAEVLGALRDANWALLDGLATPPAGRDAEARALAGHLRDVLVRPQLALRLQDELPTIERQATEIMVARRPAGPSATAAIPAAGSPVDASSGGMAPALAGSAPSAGGRVLRRGDRTVRGDKELDETLRALRAALAEGPIEVSWRPLGEDGP